jgi:hypothetical protein
MVNATPRALHLPVPIIQAVGLRVGLDVYGEEKCLAPSGFEHRTIQPERSRYRDYAVAARKLCIDTYMWPAGQQMC